MSAVPRSSGRGIIAAGLLGAALLSLLYSVVVPRLGWNASVRGVVSYLVFWVPLVAATVWWASTRRPVFRESLRFKPIDILWGLVIGLLARAIAVLIDWLVYGRAGGVISLPTIDGEQPNPWLLAFTVILAPALLAPFIEELFFRGALLSSLRTRARGSAAIAVVASAVIFALMHLLQATSGQQLLATGGSTLVMGLAAGILAVTTGRLGGAIVAHITFNAAVLLPSLLG